MLRKKEKFVKKGVLFICVDKSDLQAFSGILLIA